MSKSNWLSGFVAYFISNQLKKKNRIEGGKNQGRSSQRYSEQLEDRTLLSAFTPGNIAVLDLAATGNNTTGSIVELSPTIANQNAVQTISINGTTGTNALRFSDSGTSSFLSDSSDGTQLVLAAYNTTDSTTSDLATTGTNATTGTDPDDRAVATIGNSGPLSIQAHYVEPTSGDQTRSAATLTDNNTNYFITDKGGLFTNNATAPSLSTNILNARAFGGTVYVSSTKVGAVSTVSADNATSLNGLALPIDTSTGVTATWSANVATFTVTSNTNYPTGSTVVISGMTPSAYNNTYTVTGTSGSTKFTVALPESSSPGSGTGGTAVSDFDGSIQDFYMVQSGQNGSTYDLLYTLDQGGSSATINKFYLNSGTWTAEGSYAVKNSSGTAINATGMIAQESGGQVDLYVVTTAQAADNALVEYTDTAAYNATISVTGANAVTLYTVNPSTATLKGIAFTPTASALGISGLPTSVNAASGGPAVSVAGGNASFADTLTSSQLNASQLKAAITQNGDNANDTLGIANQGTAAGDIGISGSNVNYYYASGTATTIGTFTGGSNGNSLVITLNNATSESAAAIQALLNDITFQSTSSSTATRTVTFTFTPSAGNGSAVNDSENVNVQQAPLINAGSTITLGENYGAYSTTLTGINDNENDGNTNVTSIAASVTATSNNSLFASSPAVTNYSSSAGTATLGFTLAPNQTGTATITVTVTNSFNLSSTATYSLTVNPITVITSAILVTPGNTVTLTAAELTASETGIPAANLVYTLTGNPPASDGTLSDNGVTLLQNSTFTQADVNNGLVTYISTGSISATDNIAFSVSDSAGGSLTNQSFSVSVVEPQAFIPGDLAVLQLAAKSDNTSGSVLELNSSTANQSHPVETIPLTEMGFSDSGTSSFLSDTSDGTLLSFAAYDANATTPVSEGISGASWSGGTVTIAAGNSFAVGNSVTITGITPSAYDGTFTISAIGTGANANATFSYALASNPGVATQFANAGATSLTTDLGYDVANNARAVGTLNSAGTFNTPMTYTEIAAGDQTRSATSTDDTNWVVTDKQGTYTNLDEANSVDGGNWIDFNTLNARSFGGVIYISSTSPKAPEQTGVSGDTSGAIPPAAVLTLASPTAIIGVGLPGIPTDANIQDFYLIQSGVNGNTYDTLYTLDATGVINKFSLSSPGQSDALWVSDGSYTLGGSPLSMVAENNGSGGASLYVTTSTKLEELTDTAGYNTNINVTASPVTLFTASGSNVLKGLAFAPTELPDFSISAAASSGAAIGGDFNNTLTATNSGPASASGVSVKFILPTGETFVSASGNDGFTGAYSNGVVTFSGGSLSSGASATLTITVSASAAGTYTLPVGAAVIDPGNAITQGTEYVDNFNTSAVNTVVTSAADLTVDVSAPATAYTNQPFTYTLSAANNGDTAATWTSNQVALQFTLPGSNFVASGTNGSNFGFTESQSGNTVYFSGGTLAALTTDLLTITVTDADAESPTVASGAAVIDPNNDITESPLNTGTSSTSTPTTVITPALTISDIPIAPVVNTAFTGAVASFSDALAPGTIAVTINWGDGGSSPGTISSSVEDGPANPGIVEPTQPYTLYVVSGTHTYASTGTYAVTVAINDGTGDTGNVSESASVGEPPLQITAAPFDADVQTAFTNQTVATFTDPGIAGAGASGPASQYTSQFTASINWGDTTPATAGTIAFNSATGVFSVQGSHTYAATGGYSATVTVTPQTISVSLLDSSDPTALSKEPSAEFIQQLSPSVANQSVPINTLALPTVATTSGNFALTASAGSPSESRLHLSVNGEYLVLGGYDATVASTSDQSYLDSPSTVYRVVGTIDGEGDVNTTTALTDADYLDNFRGAVSVDGTSFYTYGSSDNLYGQNQDGTGYVHYVAPGDVGSANPSTEITNVDNDNNGVEIFNNTLYDAIRSPKTGNDVSGIYLVGTPGTLPTTANQTSSLFLEVPQTNPFTVDDSNKTTAPYDFFMADLPGNPSSINGVNVAYIADGSSGIERFDYGITGSESTAQWNFSYYISSTGTFSPSLYTIDNDGENDGQLYTAVDYTASNPPPVDASLAGGITGLTGEVLPNGQVELFGVTAGVGYGSIKNAVPANSVIEVTDSGNTGAFNGASANYTVLATAGSNAEYRGVALSPSAVVTSNASVSIPTSLAALSAPSTALVGNSISVSTQLSQTSAPAGPIAGEQVVFTETDPTGAPTMLTGTTDSNGDVSVSFPISLRGDYSFIASFAGTSTLAASTSNTTTVASYQRTILSLSPVSTAAGRSTTVTATLIAIPSDTPVAGETVTLNFSGGLPSQSVTTDSNGQVAVSVVFPSAGTFTVSGSFIDAANFYTNHTGAFPVIAETATTTATVTAGVTSLALTVPSTTLVGNLLSVSAALTRADVPAGPIANASVTFTLTGPASSPTTQMLTVTTDSNGDASVLLPISLRGVYSVSANYSGSSALAPSSATSGTITAYQPTSLSLPSSVSSVAGNSVSLSATLTTTPGGAPIAGETISFDFGGAIPPQTAVTDSIGVATVNATFPISGSFTATASFLDAANYYADHTGAFPVIPETASTMVTVAPATTSLAALSGPTTALVGNSITVSTQLTRTSVPAGPIAGEQVIFTATDPLGAPTTFTGTTDSNGDVSATFPISLRGDYSFSASFAGTSTLAASTSNTATVASYQPTMLDLSPISTAAGRSTTVTATLIAIPGDTPIAGEMVTLNFSGGLPSQSVTTDSNGQAAVNVVFPSSGTFTVSASFIDAANFYTNHTGAFPVVAETATTTATVSAGVTSLALTAPATTLVGNLLSVSATLTRDDAPAGGIANASVTFSLTGPTTQTLTGTTDSNGNVSVSFPISLRGVYSVSAVYAGSAALGASSSNSTVTAYQRTSLALPSVSTAAGRLTTVSATLTALPGGAPVAGETITFNFGGVIPSQSATTNANGVATVGITFPSAGAFVVSASFIDAANFYADHTGAFPVIAETATTTATVSAGITSLALTAPATTLVGNLLSVSATLSRVDAPAGDIAGASVTFSLTGPTTQTLTGTTDSNGNVSVSFPISLRGVYSVSASYAGSAALGASSSNTATVTAYQRTSLSLPSVTGIAGSSVSLSATLTTTPGGAPIAGETVTFNFGGVIPSQSATTNANGVATVSVTFPSAGSFPVSASFIDAANYYADHTGAFPVIAETATTTATINLGVGILLLDKTGSGALTDSGSASVQVTNGLIDVNSTSSSAIAVSGAATVSATQVNDAGGDSVTGSGKITGTLKIKTTPVADPLAGLAAPNPSSLTVQSSSALTIGGVTVITLNPGVYIGGISVGGSAKVTLSAGIYYLEGGGFSVSGAAVVTDLGKGVLLYNAAVKSSDSISVSGSGKLTLSCMATGPYQGLVIFQARTATAALSFSGAALVDLTGSVYAAAAALDISGSADLQINDSPLDSFGAMLIVDSLNNSGAAIVDVIV